MRSLVGAAAKGTTSTGDLHCHLIRITSSPATRTGMLRSVDAFGHGRVSMAGEAPFEARLDRSTASCDQSTSLLFVLQPLPLPLISVLPFTTSHHQPSRRELHAELERVAPAPQRRFGGRRQLEEAKPKVQTQSQWMVSALSPTRACGRGQRRRGEGGGILGGRGSASGWHGVVAVSQRAADVLTRSRMRFSLACRKSKHKCDEQKPVCVRCRVSDKEVRSSSRLAVASSISDANVAWMPR